MRDVTSEKSPWGQFVESLSELPMDYLGVLGFVLLTDAVLVSFPRASTPVRILVGAPLLLFIPGYTLVGALFPARRTGTDPHAPRALVRGPTVVQRLALSFGISIALVPFLAVAIQFAGLAYDVGTVLSTLSVVVVGTTVVAGIRRARLPESQRYHLPAREAWTDFRRWLAAPTQADAAVNAVLVVAVLLAVTAAGYAFVAPAQSESYTTFSLLTDQGGDLVAGEYPSELTFGESTPLVASVENHEGHAVSYTAVVLLQEVDRGGGETTVVREQELDRMHQTVGAGETWRARHEVTPRTTGTDLRLTYLLFVGDVPDDPTVAAAHRHLYIWVDVTGPASGSAGST